MPGTQGAGWAPLRVATLLVALMPVPAAAQSPLAILVRGGIHAPVGSAAGQGVGPGEELDAGASWGVAFALHRGGGNHLELGFGQHRAGCPGQGCTRRVATQWEVGWRRDFGDGPVVPWLRVGAVVPRVERVVTAAGLRTSGTGFGGEAGGGVRFPLGGRIHAAPGLRAGWGRVPVPDRDDALPLRWIVGDLTLVLVF